MFTLGGKRIRPVLVLMACEMFGRSFRAALPAALAIETFHNFTLVHDDIMDNAPIRRGKETVYKKWDSNIAILAGDTMLSMAYDMMIAVESKRLSDILRLFNKTSIEVCEGQQYDMNFENIPQVSIPQYLEMIRLKTAVLLGASLSIGAIIGGAEPQDEKLLYDIGINMGIAFQLKDDLLDVYGEVEKFGKQEGGDIATNKKTFLYLKALEKAPSQVKAELSQLYNTVLEDNEAKIKRVKEIFDVLGIAGETNIMIEGYYQTLMQNIGLLNVPGESKQPLRDLADKLAHRTF
jgi:geranylgeranyl diphosphate synthase type II